MGCASSKDKVCPKCQSTYLRVQRSSSFNCRRRRRKTGDYTHHSVSLTSSTLGSLNLDRESSSEEFSRFKIGLIEAKTWSEMIEEKIPKVIVPKTPAFTPPGEPEKINAWELMEGLEDTSPLKPARHLRTFSFNLPSYYSGTTTVSDENYKPEIDSPIFRSNSTSNSTISDFDPDVFRNALELEDLPPPASPFPFHLKKDKVTVYFTTLRGVRKTYEECCQVLAILKAHGVRIDERDVSMHSAFKEELRDLLGGGGGNLPSVFIGKKYVGGGEEIRRLNEEGELGEIVEGCEREVDEGGNLCHVCGNIRFIPCQKCSGSCKILYEDDDEEEDDEDGFHRCPDCNENGLLRCPVCCDF